MPNDLLYKIIPMIFSIIAIGVSINTFRMNRINFNPIFSILHYSVGSTSPRSLTMTLENNGFNYYVVDKVSWIGDSGINLMDHKLVTGTHTLTAGDISKHKGFSMRFKIEQNTSSAGYICISGKNVRGKRFVCYSPFITIKNGQLLPSTNLKTAYFSSHKPKTS